MTVSGLGIWHLDWVARASPDSGLGSWAIVGEDTLGLASVRGAGLNVPSLAAVPAGTEVVFVPYAPRSAHVAAVVEELRGLVADWITVAPPSGGTRLVVVTRGPVLAPAGSNPVHAAAWGVLRTAMAEHPDRFGMVDIDDRPESVETMCRTVAVEPEFAVRAGQAFVPRLRPTPDPASPASRPFVGPDRSDGVVLVVGDTAGAAGVVARYLDTGSTGEGGVRTPAGTPPTGGCGGVVCWEPGCPTELDSLLRTLSPKAVVVTDTDPALLWRLHESTRDLGPVRLILFSELAGVIGAPGAPERAAAAAYADAVVRHRRAEGRPATAVAWGPWGARQGPTRAERRWLAALGVAELSVADGLAALARAWHLDDAVLVPLAMEPPARSAARLPAAMRDIAGGVLRE